MKNNFIKFVIGALLLLILPFFAQYFGNGWVRIIDAALLYMMLALGLNIVVGYAGLLDLGYVAFYAVGAYMFGELASPHLTDTFDWFKNTFTNGPKGLDTIDSIHIFGLDLGKDHTLFGLEVHSVSCYYFLFLALVIFAVLICYRLERSRIGRAWMAIREDEIAAKAMGINTRNLKLLAFGMGATFGGVSGVMFGAFQGFVSPESFSLDESIMIVAMVVVGGIGHIPGVLLGALLLSALPEVLRYVAGPLQEMTGGRLDSAILRQLLIALAMIGVMLSRPRGLWPSPEHGKAAPTPVPVK